MHTAKIFAMIGGLVPIAFGVLPDTECGVINIWYSGTAIAQTLPPALQWNRQLLHVHLNWILIAQPKYSTK